MKSRLLNLLICPKCKGGLSLKTDKNKKEEIIEGSLNCLCGAGYAIRGGIPRFVASDQYVSNFSFEWNLHRRTQFDNDYSRESYETFLQKTGFTPEDIKGRLVLDAGCGAGRFMDAVLKMEGECVGIDLSFAVDAAYGNLGEHPGAHIVQADIFNLPFKPEIFDRIYSIGVLHHTPDTRKAFLALPPLMKKGGKIAVWLYDSYSTGQTINNLCRKLTTRIPKRLLYLLCSLSVPYYYLKKIPLLGRLFRLAWLSSDHPGWRWRWLDTFDWYSPRYQWKHRYPEVVRWFKEAGLEVTDILEPPVAVQGRKNN